jgi:hypothetical protein
MVRELIQVARLTAMRELTSLMREVIDTSDRQRGLTMNVEPGESSVSRTTPPAAQRTDQDLSFHGDPIDLNTVIKETPKLPGGGTLGVHLAGHALSRGYEVATWVCNVRHVDPTWFQQPTDLLAKLRARFEAKGLSQDPRYGPALEAIEQYVRLGGHFVWGDLTPELLGSRLARAHRC